MRNPNFRRSWPRFWSRPILATRILGDISFDPDPHEAQNAQNHLPPFGPPQIGWFIPQTCLWALENPQIPQILTTVRIKPFKIRVPNGDPHLHIKANKKKWFMAVVALVVTPCCPWKIRILAAVVSFSAWNSAGISQQPWRRHLFHDLPWLLWQGAKFLWY